jgi:hypothetical protein
MSIFSSPIGRLVFVCRLLPAILIMVGTVIVSIADHNLTVIDLCLVLSFLATIYIIGFAIFPRLVSVGVSQWFSLLYFVPVVNLGFILFLAFCPIGHFKKHETVA